MSVLATCHWVTKTEQDKKQQHGEAIQTLIKPLKSDDSSEAGEKRPSTGEERVIL